ncbi:CHASE2 domain-containing protein [Leptolyngbya sp. PCC 6406]|uniref:CHASE2 domain-containing protein n=1 Tax=Leptolyngbya sp. PCC 6406 TaxID=1173264 RepID=UPI0002ED52C6|nr:adenylate/guanylate cyclase domain-containing protein [Leptolyngbya sp. PCC 6406]
MVTLVSVGVSLTVLGVNQLGILESAEWLAYDQMVRLRHLLGEPPLDDRLLLVTITEEDLQEIQALPLTDQTIATVLAHLQTHQPAAIGLDIYRAIPQPPGQGELGEQIRAENVVVITKLPDVSGTGIPAPEGVDPDRIGFNDVVVDADGTIRRSLIMGEQVTPEGPQVIFSLSLRLALRYLALQNITPQSSVVNPHYMQLGPSTFVPLQPGSGGYARTDAGGYQVLLDYRHSLAPARQVTLMEVLQNQVDPDWVRGKIILIGMTAPSGKDLFYTPFTRAGIAATHQMPGVFIHAQMVSQYLDAATGARSLIWLSVPWQEALWCLGWALLAGTVAWRLRHPVAFALSQNGLLMALAAVGFSLFLQRAWVPIVAPTVGIVGTSGIVLAYQAQQSARQRQMMLMLLGQNTSPEIADALWENRDRLLKSGKLPGQKTTATMLFTDIRGFSTLAEVTPPEQLLDWLNEYLSAMTDAIQTHHGIVNKFTGDGLLAVFGVPITRNTPEAIAQDAQNAVHCALTMAACMDRLNQHRQTRNQPLLQMRVGIFTGAVVVGSLGGQTRMEYGIIGDSVNIASRLESFDKTRQPTPCRILIGEDTLAYLQNQFQVESWGALTLKGRHAPIGVYRVLAHSTL